MIGESASRQRDRETKRQRDRGTEGQRDRETERQRARILSRQRDRETESTHLEQTERQRDRATAAAKHTSEQHAVYNRPPLRLVQALLVRQRLAGGVPVVGVGDVEQHSGGLAEPAVQRLALCGPLFKLVCIFDCAQSDIRTQASQPSAFVMLFQMSTASDQER